MDFFNFNFLHNLINVAIAALTSILLASGCVSDDAGTITCAQSWISPQITAIAILVLAGLKIAMNIFRDGLGGLIKKQPPVQK